MYFLNPAYQINFLPRSQAALFSESENYFIQDSNIVALIKMIHENKNNGTELLNRLRADNCKFDSLLGGLIEKGIIIRCNEKDDNNIKHSAFWNSLKISSSLVRKNLDQHVVTLISYLNRPFDEMAKIFENLGIQTGECGTFYIVIANDYLDPRLRKHHLEFTDKKIPWMLVKPTGKIIWVGPIFNSCHELSYITWGSLSNRIKENCHSKTDIFGFDGEELPLSTSIELPTNSSIAYNIVANETLKWIVNGQSELSKNIITYNNLNLEMKTHYFSEYLQYLTPQIPSESPIEFQKSKKEFHNEFGSRCCSPDVTYEKVKGFTSHITGFISKSFYRMENDFHIYYGTRSLNYYTKNMTFIPPRSPDVVVGKSKNKKEAEVAFIAESIERYFSTDINLHSKYVASYKEISESSIHPNLLMGFSSEQYSKRVELNRKSGPYHWIPLPFDESAEISWIKLNAVSSSVSKFFPASYCYTNFPSSQELLMCPGNSNGCATGNSFEEALLYGLLEVIERDAMAIWWYNRLKRPSIDLSSFNSSYIESSQENLRKHKRTLRLIDISCDINIPVFVAISWLEDGSRIVLGSGAHLNPLVGIQRAIAEHNQILTRATVPSTIDLANILPAERDLVHWLIHEKISSHPFLNEETSKNKSKNGFCEISSDTFDEDIQTCLAALTKSGLDAFWLPLTPCEFPLKVVKVIVPGMRHFWRRLGNGRLYQVPVLMNELQAPLSEDQMNPISYFV